MPADNFLPWSTGYVHYPGSSGYTAGGSSPSIYPSFWNAGTGTSVSSNPALPGFDQFGRYKPGVQFPTVGPYANLAGVSPASGMGGAAGGYNPAQAPGYNPYWTVSNIKSQPIADQVSSFLGDLTTMRGQNPGALAQSLTTAANPNFAQYLKEDVGAAGAYFNGDIQKQLDTLRTQRRNAYSVANELAKGDASRLLALGRMAQGGAATPGTSSYFNQQALNAATQLNAQAGLDDANQAAQNFQYLQGAKLGLLGSRANLTNSDIQRQLMPSQVNAQWFNNMLASLGALNQVQQSNTFYGLGGGPPVQQINPYAALGGQFNPGEQRGVMPQESYSPDARYAIPQASPRAQLAAPPVQYKTVNVYQPPLAAPMYPIWGNGAALDAPQNLPITGPNTGYDYNPLLLDPNIYA